MVRDAKSVSTVHHCLLENNCRCASFTGYNPYGLPGAMPAEQQIHILEHSKGSLNIRVVRQSHITKREEWILMEHIALFLSLLTQQAKKQKQKKTNQSILAVVRNRAPTQSTLLLFNAYICIHENHTSQTVPHEKQRSKHWLSATIQGQEDMPSGREVMPSGRVMEFQLQSITLGSRRPRPLNIVALYEYNAAFQWDSVRGMLLLLSTQTQATET